MCYFLKRMCYTGPFHGHPKEVTTGNLNCKVLETDHLSQNYRLVDQPQTFSPAPILSEWEENYILMVQEFASEATRVGLSTPPRNYSPVNVIHQTPKDAAKFALS